jgi:hypothetical protein
MTLVWRPGFMFDADASTYIEAVELADGQTLEAQVRYAINDFVIGCKNDGIWTAIKASCIMAGARTLAGALVPLVGAAPTNVGFAAGDYNRETGLLGNGSTKYLNSNRAGNADPQDNLHMSVYATTFTTTTQYLIGHGEANAGAANIGYFSGNTFFRCRNLTASNLAGNVTGFIGQSRNASGSFSARQNNATTLFNVVSQPSSTSNSSVFASGTNVGSRSNSRLAFYSIGESLNLALLDSRVATLMSAIAAAIP